METAIKVLRQAGYYSHAVYLAEKHAHHEWYLKIQLEDIKVRRCCCSRGPCQGDHYITSLLFSANTVSVTLPCSHTLTGLLRQQKQSRLPLVCWLSAFGLRGRRGVKIGPSYLLCIRCGFLQCPVRGGRVVSERVIGVVLWPQPVFLLEETNKRNSKHGGNSESTVAYWQRVFDALCQSREQRQIS